MSDTKKIEWFENKLGPTIYPEMFEGSAVGLWLTEDGKWCSNTPPIFGTWDTVEEGKAAIILAIRRKAERLIASLPDDGQPADTGSISDGYHTFDELYEHRVTLWIALCRELAKRKFSSGFIWKSLKHSDGSNYDGWFMLGHGMGPGKQITYHLPLSRWDECDFARTRERAPTFDGHTSADVLERIKAL